MVRRALAGHWVVLAALLAAAAWPAHAAPARLLVFTDTSIALPWHAQYIDALRRAVHKHHPDAELDIETFPDLDEADVGRAPDWMQAKYAQRRYDILLVARANALEVAIRLRDRLWPLATVVAAVDDGALRAALRQRRGVTGLAPTEQATNTLSLIFQLLPDTRHVAVIARTLGPDPLRPDWQRGIDQLRRRAALIDLSGLPPDQLLARVRQLPPRSAVFVAAPVTASTGPVTTPRDLVEQLSRLGSAPVFVDASTLVGNGALGGAVMSPETYAEDAAGQIHALLTGTRAEDIGLQLRSLPRYVFDWQALQRWHVPMDRLPARSVVLGQPPALWDTYRSQVLLGAGVVVMQSALIAALLIERRRRHRAELHAREHLAHLARLNRGAALGALSAALAHEINQPLGAILSNAETAELVLEGSSANRKAELLELLAAIREDDQRAAAVLRRLRSWMAGRPAVLQPLALDAVLQAVATWLATELRLRRIDLQVALTPGLPLVQADEVQLQQVVLNLVLNAADAVQAAMPARRRIVIGAAVAGARSVEVTVQDNGRGLGDVDVERLFAPFYTTKPGGLGVGLAISRSIVEQHGGTLHASNVSTGGACFRFTLPVVGPARAV